MLGGRIQCIHGCGDDDDGGKMRRTMMMRNDDEAHVDYGDDYDNDDSLIILTSSLHLRL